jgi:DNA-binding MarR family transcriptional regulator
MNTVNKKTIKHIVNNLRRLLRAVYLDAARMNRLYGVTGQQGLILRSLHNSGSASSVDLSRLLHVSPSNMTGLIDRLEKKNLVVRARKEGDRRITMIELTEAGKALGKKLPDPLEMKLESKLADLDPDHVRELSLAIDDLLSVVGPVEGDVTGFDVFPEKGGDADIANGKSNQKT